MTSPLGGKSAVVAEPAQFQERTTAGNRIKHPEEATAYLHLTMKTMAEIAGILEKAEDEIIFEKYAAGAKEAYNYLFVKSGTLATNRQAKIVHPLAFGLLDGEDTSIARYIWLPIEWEGEKPVIRWQDSWRVEDLK